MSSPSLNAIIESVFPLASEVARSWHELDSIGSVHYRNALCDAASDPDAPILEKMTANYRVFIVGALDFASYAENHVRSADPSATYLNDRCDGDR